MSHYIVARGTGDEELATLQMSWHTIDQLASWQFDICGLYQAESCNGGVSGNGAIRAIDVETAKNAYLWCRAWCRALAAIEPADSAANVEPMVPETELFTRSLDDDDERRMQASQSQIVAQFEAESLAEYDADLIRCRDAAAVLSRFTERVYAAAVKGEARIHFV